MQTSAPLAVLLGTSLLGCMAYEHRCRSYIEVRPVTAVVDNSTQGVRAIRKGEMLQSAILTVSDFDLSCARVREHDITITELPPLLDHTVVEYYVEIPMTDDGDRKFRAFTENHVDEFLAVIINEKVLMTPLIREAVSGALRIPVDSPEAGSQLVEQLRTVKCDVRE